MQKIAVVIRHYSLRKQFLQRILDSLAAQSMDNFIVCIFNMNKENHINNGLFNTSSVNELFAFLDNQSIQYICVLDDDDSLAPEFFKRTLSVIENHPFESVKAITTHTNKVVELCEGNRIKTIRTEPLNHHLNYGILALDTLRYKDSLRLSSFLFDYNSFKLISQNHNLEHPLFFWPFIIEFGANYDIWILGEAMAFYHVRETSDIQSNNYSIENPFEYETYIRYKLNKLYRVSYSNPALSGILQKIIIA